MKLNKEITSKEGDNFLLAVIGVFIVLGAITFCINTAVYERFGDRREKIIVSREGKLYTNLIEPKLINTNLASLSALDGLQTKPYKEAFAECVDNYNYGDGWSHDIIACKKMITDFYKKTQSF